MKKKYIRQAISYIIIMFLITVMFSYNTYAVMGRQTEKPSYTGATVYSEDTSLSETEYTSNSSKENALLVEGGKIGLTNPTVTKSGDASDEESDFYGTNAAVLVYNGATLNIEGGTITTNGKHANAVFAYGTGTLNLLNTTIKTSKDNSGGIMVTGGGTFTANNVTVTTEGRSSASIRSDRGGGTMIINGGTYTTNGIGSPAIYSTADIVVNNASLISTASEGAVVEGANKITLNGVTLTDTNNTLNGNSETYKNIFLYQSMSGDADEGTAEFTAKDSTIITNKGDTIYITNTNAVINLENNVFTNDDGCFLRVEGAKWGKTGSNGGTVTLTTSKQTFEGDIIADNISTIDMLITNGSKYSGTINSKNSAKSIVVALDKYSTLTLTGDSYITSLTNEVTDNSNINLNGYKLYIGEEEITETEFAEPEYIEDTNTTDIKNENTTNDNKNSQEEKVPVYIYIISILIVGVVLGVVIKKTALI